MECHRCFLLSAYAYTRLSVTPIATFRFGNDDRGRTTRGLRKAPMLAFDLCHDGKENQLGQRRKSCHELRPSRKISLGLAHSLSNWGLPLILSLQIQDATRYTGIGRAQQRKQSAKSRPSHLQGDFEMLAATSSSIIRTEQVTS